MGEIRTKVLLENEFDWELAHSGRLAMEDVRTQEIDAVVDTGAVATLLPKELVEALGLTVIDSVVVTLADESHIRLDRAAPLRLTICGRRTVGPCLVGPEGCEPLIGQIVMEDLDLIADPRKRTLTPRPESPDFPTLKLKALAASTST